MTAEKCFQQAEARGHLCANQTQTNFEPKKKRSWKLSFNTSVMSDTMAKLEVCSTSSLNWAPCVFSTRRTHEKIHEAQLSFTSGIPEPHAYGAKARTSATARKEKSKAQKMYIR